MRNAAHYEKYEQILSQLIKALRKEFGASNATVIRQVRIDRAKRELAPNDRSMAEIARNVGFSGPERLNEVFHRELGISPGAWWRKGISPELLRSRDFQSPPLGNPQLPASTASRRGRGQSWFSGFSFVG